jgi:hypothetical protein
MNQPATGKPSYQAAKIGKGEHPRGSIFGPSRRLLPGTILFGALWVGLISAAVAILELRHMLKSQMFFKCLAD